MHPMQLSSFAVYMGNQPSLFAVLRQANTSTGQTARQKPHALHMSSLMTTSHLPAGPRDAFLSVLNNGMPGPLAGDHPARGPRHDLQHDLLGAGDMRAGPPLGGLAVTRNDGLEDAPVLRVGVLEPALGLEQQGMELADGQPHHG